ncbi:unnamed protein product, partial [Prorocentrum cordatum]
MFDATFKAKQDFTGGMRISQKRMEAVWDEMYHAKFVDQYREQKGRKPTSNVLAGHRLTNMRTIVR